MKILNFILIYSFLFSPLSYSGDEKTPEDLLREQMSYYHSEYPDYLKQKYELAISEYYWKRTYDLNTLAQAIEQRLQRIDNEVESQKNDFYKNLTDSELTPLGSLTLLRSISNSIEQKAFELQEYMSSSKSLINKIQIECLDENMTKESSKFDPRYIFTVPQYAFTAGEAPQIDTKVYFQVNYSTGDGQFNSSAEIENEQMDDTQAAIVYGGAAIVVGVAMAFGVEEPNTLSLIFAISVAILQTVTSFFLGTHSQHEYKKQMEKLIVLYDELNNDIYKVHEELVPKSNEIFKNYCQKSFGEKNQDKLILVSLYEEKLKLLSNKYIEIKNLASQLQQIVVQQEKAVLGQVQSDAEFFNRFEEEIAQKYSESVDKLFEYESQLDIDSFNYFLEKPAVRINTISEKGKTLEKLNQVYGLWDEVIIGDAKYDAVEGPKSINWAAFKNQTMIFIQEELKW